MRTQRVVEVERRIVRVNADPDPDDGRGKKQGGCETRSRHL